MSKWERERYKNDPEYLELLRQRDNEAQKYIYKRKKKEQKENDNSIRNCIDSNAGQR